ncbi:MAG: response regulator transcription factor [Terracidiphilus sp.]|jgi:DNA-binding NarL/FixJ family response regulator
MNDIRIFMVDDHSLFREGLSRLLETAPDLCVVGQCGTAAEAVSALARTPADVVLLDYDLGQERGSSVMTELKNCQHEVKILMVTAGMSEAATSQIMEAGASGVFLKQSNPDQLVEAIHRVTNNGIWLDSEAVRSLVSAKSARAAQVEHQRPLTARQTEVLRGILDGLTNKEIAWKLKASESSIKAVIQELFHKAGVRTRSQLVRIAIENHSSDWLKPDSKDSC